MNFLSIFFMNVLSIGYVQSGNLAGTTGGNDISMNLKEVYIDIDLKKASVDKLFGEVEERTDFKFFYDNEVLRNKYSFTFDKYISLYDLLFEVSKISNLEFRQVNKNINVRTKERQRQGRRETVPIQSIKVIGKVNSADMPEGIPFVNILVKGTSTGTVTDVDGNYSVEVPSENSVLVFTSVGFATQEIVVGDRRVINVTLGEDVQALEEVVVTGYGSTQKKGSLVSSITSISTKDLKVSSSNLTNAFAGRIPGMISYQRSGEPGQDNSDFFIRGLGTFGAGKRDPLILIDNIESTSTDLARLQADDIEAFSVLKDATAAAVYGARGANGVILVTTKSGEIGETKFQFRAENKLSANTQNFKLADNISYMEMENEAFLTRGFLQTPNFPKDIERTATGDNPLLYPSNDWIDLLIKPYTINQSYNMSAKGGGKRARYYLSGTYNVDNGVLNVEPVNDFNNNIKLINYSIRSNVDIQLTKNLDASIRIYGQFDDYTGPLGGKDRDGNNISGGQRIFNLAIAANPVKFPAVYPSELKPFIGHPLFGSAISSNGNSLLINPYAEMVKGYEVSKAATLQPQVELNQDLSFLTKGLKVGVMGYVRRYSRYTIKRSYNPFYYTSTPTTTGDVELRLLNHGEDNTSIGTTGSETLGFESAGNVADSRVYLQATINYGRTFNDKHDVSAFLIGLLQSFETGDVQGGIQGSLPRRNQGISGKFTYGFDNRYLAEFNFGYNGSERFSKNNRFGFFPSAGVAYHISNEDFWTPIRGVIDDLKFRFSYGFVGNDQIGSNDDRFFYLSNVELAHEFYNAQFGEFLTEDRDGVLINRYANPLISWETSEQYNLGVDMTLFKSLDVVAEIFKQNRTNILEPRTYIGSTMGLNPVAEPQANTGKAESKGIDLSAVYNKYGRNKFLQLSGNMTYSTSKVIARDEVSFPEGEEYRSVIGNPVNQTYGFIAERLFVDDDEVMNSPRQFGIYQGGDIKYRDVNGDGIISDADRVPIGFPTVPEIIYGFGGVFGLNSIDIGIFFQGAARTSFSMDPRKITPFDLYELEGSEGLAQNGLLKAIADSYWSEENRDVYALWPRLSNRVVDNNVRSSTWWLRNGSFLRLKSVEIGFTFPERVANKLHLDNLRIYGRGTNLYSWSRFKLWDPEMGGNGLGYPIQAIYAVGALVNF